MSFILSTESNSEIPWQWEDEFDVKVLRMPYSIEGVEYYYDLGRQTDIKGFYDRMRGGATVTTAQRNPAEVVEFWTPFLEAGHDILHIAFSSALSGTFNCEQMARGELLEKYPGRKIILIDTLAISAPLGQLVRHAADMKAKGCTMEEIAEWVEANKQRSCALFTVDKLEYLRRGGRVSGAAAFFGSMLEIKPVLYISPDGKLIPLEKVKGRKKALKYLVEKCAATIENASEQVITICEADCMEEARQLEEMVREKIAPKDIMINPVGPVIGSHCGPGTLALVYFARSREELNR
ncbi:MAG: DegV family protein [Clostridia bacterium]|nr:DegV family protein [Clostridia bacterium]